MPNLFQKKLRVPLSAAIWLLGFVALEAFAALYPEPNSV